MRVNSSQALTSLCVFAFLLIGACSTSTRVAKTFEDPDYDDASFGNFLIIGVAGDYDGRAQFERTLVSRLKNQGATASAYHSIVDGNKPLARDVVIDVIREHGFDAVLVTRLISQQADVSVSSGSSEAKATTKGGRPIDFFRYDYDVLNEPDTINVTTTVVLKTELFSAADEKMIWSIEYTSLGRDHVGQLIEDTADTIIDRLGRDRRIGH